MIEPHTAEATQYGVLIMVCRATLFTLALTFTTNALAAVNPNESIPIQQIQALMDQTALLQKIADQNEALLKELRNTSNKADRTLALWVSRDDGGYEKDVEGLYPLQCSNLIERRQETNPKRKYRCTEKKPD